MIVIGLTGSIGMGKSTAARMLERIGYAVHDSDAVARRSLEPYGDAFEAVALTFPEAWNKKKHIIDRIKLAEIIYGNQQQKEKLEAIIHPIVQASQKKFIQAQKVLGMKKVILDIPLLFETCAEKRVDYTAVVSAPYFIQRHRVLKRANMTTEKFQAILKNQMSDKDKRKRADFIIPTGLGLAYTQRALIKMMKVIDNENTDPMP